MSEDYVLTDEEIQKQKANKTLETVAWRASFYRDNPHRFAEEFLGIHLTLFQKILLWLLMFSTNFYYLASRGQLFLKEKR